jgi:hypothetical protein
MHPCQSAFPGFTAIAMLALVWQLEYGSVEDRAVLLTRRTPDGGAVLDPCPALIGVVPLKPVRPTAAMQVRS